MDLPEYIFKVSEIADDIEGAKKMIEHHQNKISEGYDNTDLLKMWKALKEDRDNKLAEATAIYHNNREVVYE